MTSRWQSTSFTKPLSFLYHGFENTYTLCNKNSTNNCSQRRKRECKSTFSYSHSLKTPFDIQSFHPTQYSYPSHGSHRVHSHKAAAEDSQLEDLAAQGSWCRPRKGQGKEDAAQVVPVPPSKLAGVVAKTKPMPQRLYLSPIRRTTRSSTATGHTRCCMVCTRLRANLCRNDSAPSSETRAPTSNTSGRNPCRHILAS
jgi:hypothetical protein